MTKFKKFARDYLFAIITGFMAGFTIIVYQADGTELLKIAFLTVAAIVMLVVAYFLDLYLEKTL